jgi:hypothetical protein
MSKNRYQVRNWKDYNQSLKKRGEITFWFSPEVTSQWLNKEKTGARGRPVVYSEIAITCALTLRQLFRLPLRATHGLVKSLLALLKMEARSPDPSSLSRRGKGLKINLSATIDHNQPHHVLVDSTGVRVIGEGEWKMLHHGKSRWRVWKKLHLAMDANNHMILAATTTESVRQDGNYLPQLLDEIAGSISQVTGDGAYDKRNCYQAAHKRGAKAVFPPCHNAGVQRSGRKKDPALLTRDQAIEFFKQGNYEEQRKQWKQENNYHRRSLVETMMSRMKWIFGDQMHARSRENQHTDLMLRCRAMNLITGLGMPESICI